MKKLLFAVVIGLLFFSLLSAQEKAVPSRPDGTAPSRPDGKDPAADMMKNLQTVEKTEAVPAKTKAGFDAISARGLMAFLAFLSHDVLEGREAGTRGYDTAAVYAQSLFALWGLKPGGDLPKAAPGAFPGMETGRTMAKPERGFLQEFAMKEAMETSAGVVLELASGGARSTRSFAPDVDFIFSSPQPLEVSAPVVFAGYGISEKAAGYDDLAGIDVKDKVVMILTEAPGRDDPASPFQKKELKEKYFAPAFARRGPGADFAKTSALFKAGALAVLIAKSSVSEGDIHQEALAQRLVRDDKPILPDDRRKLLIPGAKGMPWEGRAVIRVSREMADAILSKSGETVESLQKKIAARYKPRSLALPATGLRLSNQVRYGLVKSANVVGWIEGSDPKLKDQAVVVGGHLDHLGRRGDYVFNGAEDNASGACGVLAMARALALNPEKPKRSVVFCLWTGEEEGLLGSRWYVEHPLFAMENTLAYLNLDMIALSWDEKGLKRMARMLNVNGDELLKKIKPENFLPLSISEQAPDLRDALMAANRSVGFDVLYRETPKRMDRMSGGSDHASFAMAGRPWAFFISGMSDIYHTPGDSAEKFGGDVMEKVSRLAYLAAYLLADK
jgi:hypothetical protein